MREFVDSGFYVIDVLVGYAMFGILALLSFVGVVNLLQSKLLFNEAFSQSVQTARIKMQVKRSGKQIKRKAKPGLLMTMDEWMRSRPNSAAPSMAATVYDAVTASRAVSLAPSAAPSALPSYAPSAMTSAAASAFTSVANSGNPSRRNSMTEVLQATAAAPSIRPQPSRLGLGSAEAGDTAAGGLGGGAGGVVVGMNPAGGGPLGEQPSADVGLRERRLRFG